MIKNTDVKKKRVGRPKGSNRPLEDKVGFQGSGIHSKATKITRANHTTIKDWYEMARLSALGYSNELIGTKYNLNKNTVSLILNKEPIKDFKDMLRRHLGDVVIRTFRENAENIEKIINIYMLEALDEKRIKTTPLGQLFNVIKIISEQQLKYEELQIKRLELENKGKDSIDNGLGIIRNFEQLLSNDINNRQSILVKDSKSNIVNKTKYDIDNIDYNNFPNKEDIYQYIKNKITLDLEGIIEDVDNDKMSDVIDKLTIEITENKLKEVEEKLNKHGWSLENKQCYGKDFYSYVNKRIRLVNAEKRRRLLSKGRLDSENNNK